MSKSRFANLFNFNKEPKSNARNDLKSCVKSTRKAINEYGSEVTLELTICDEENSQNQKKYNVLPEPINWDEKQEQIEICYKHSKYHNIDEDDFMTTIATCTELKPNQFMGNSNSFGDDWENY